MYNILEEAFFKIILLLPERWIQNGIIEKYLEKRIQQLEHQKIQANWKQADLKKQIEEIGKLM